MGPSRSRSIPAFFKIVPDFTKSKVHAIIPAVRECTVGPSRASFWRNSSVEDSLIRTIMKIRKHTLLANFLLKTFGMNASICGSY